MAKNALELLLSEVRDDIERLKDGLSRGLPRERYDLYHEGVGQLRALRAIEDRIVDIYKNLDLD